VEGRLKVADYFVIVTGQNRAHVRAMLNELHIRLKAAGETHRPVEGAEMGWWVVLDYGDVIVHVLQREAREFYDLENLYADSPRIDWRALELPELPDGRTAEV
jgi:ribosome-associated protein